MVNPTFKFFLFLILLAPFCGIAAHPAKSPIRVLLLSGSNNHEWKKTTPKLLDIFARSNLFSVTVTEQPDTLSELSLKPFQVILSNWNAFPEKARQWPQNTEDAMVRFVKNGGGFVVVHAGGSAHYDWPEFQDMAIGCWGDTTKHGHFAPFQVEIANISHPITNGLANFKTVDELWVDTRLKGNPTVLASSFAPASNNGSDQLEPIALCKNYGLGRSFFLVLGHDERAMKNLGFQTLLLRGSEWAATAKVTQKIPDELAPDNPSRKLSWKKESNSVSLMNNNRIVWQYHFNKAEGKPYFHPLSVLNGSVFTELRPKDHPWHRAVWFSWKYINGLNYWEEDATSGHSEGITELKSVEYKLSKSFAADFKLQLSYHPPTGTDVLTEERTVHVSPPTEDGSYFMDWESTFTALTNEVVLDRTPLPNEPEGKSWGGYTGFSARLNNQLQEITVVNDSGKTDDLHGKPSRWLTFEAKNLKGQAVSMTIFDHPLNLNYPNKWFISNDPTVPFYYFSPAPLFDHKLVLKKGEQIYMKYRLLISPEAVNQTKLQSNWNQFITN